MTWRSTCLLTKEKKKERKWPLSLTFSIPALSCIHADVALLREQLCPVSVCVALHFPVAQIIFLATLATLYPYYRQYEKL